MKTIKRSELSNLRMSAGNEKKFTIIIDTDNQIKEWVGIGWIGKDQATDKDREKYLTVKD